MAKQISLNSLNPKCTNCGRRYSLGMALKNANKRNSRIISCPHCKQNTGTTI